jgi:3-dehydroquinate synthase
MLAEKATAAEESRIVLRGLTEFQEHLGGELTIMMLEDIGRPFDVHQIRTDLMLQSIDMLKALEPARAVTGAQKAS